MAVSVEIEKKLGDFQLAVQFQAGEETLAILGASGCGKTMTLKCIAGIETPDRGKIVLGGRVLFDSDRGINLPPQQRCTGLLFQDYALFPTMTVLENIMAGACRREKSMRKRLALDMIEKMGLKHLMHHYPAQLSGGQRQRTALARMLLSAPEILLLDEPFSALDGHLRQKMEQEIGMLLKDFGKTAILVSHDIEESYRMAARLAVMGEGVIETIGEKAAVYENPRTRKGAQLLGCSNFSKGICEETGYVLALDWNLKLLTASAAEIQDGQKMPCCIGIREKDIRLARASDPAENRCRCILEGCLENPDGLVLFLRPFGAGKETLLRCRVPFDSRTRQIEKMQQIQQMRGEIEVYLLPDAIMILTE